MRFSTVLFTIFAASTLALTACGGGDDGDGGDDDDNMDTPDAMPQEEMPDANEQPVSNGLGDVCSQQVACTSTVSTECIAIDQGAENGWCTPVCDTTADTAMQATPAGQAVCEDGYTGDATPLCAVSSPPANGMIDWYCILLCGPYTPDGGQQVELGTCPDGLECLPTAGNNQPNHCG